MAKFKFTNNAVKDLAEIWNYTVETWSENQADKYYRFLINACHLIAKKPELGETYQEIFPGLRGKIISKHIIFYRIIDDQTIEITRILHERMDLKNKFTTPIPVSE